MLTSHKSWLQSRKLLLLPVRDRGHVVHNTSAVLALEVSRHMTELKHTHELARKPEAEMVNSKVSEPPTTTTAGNKEVTPVLPTTSENIRNLNADIRSNSGSLDLLPPELLHLIGLSLPARSIIALKCMNTFFNNVFSADIFLKKCLYYPERYLMSDLRSGSTAPEMAEVVGEISSGAVGKWQGYYKLQQARLQTWLSKDINKPYFNLPINQVLEEGETYCISHVQEMVDNHGERWLFVITDTIGFNLETSGTIFIWNITSTPRDLNPFHSEGVRVKDIMKLCPEGKIILKQEYDEDHEYGDYIFIGVYVFENPTYILEMKFKIVYDEDICFSPSDILDGVDWEYSDFEYVIVGDLCITCRKDSEAGDDMTDLDETPLHIWNWTSGMKVAKVSLNQSHIVKSLTDNIETNDTTVSYIVRLYPGNSSSIIVILDVDTEFVKKSHTEIVYMFDLVTLKITLSVHQTCKYYEYIRDCHMFEDRVCIAISNCLMIYSVKGTPKILQKIKFKKEHQYRPHHKIIFNNAKALIQRGEYVDILSLDTDTMEVQRVKVTSGYILGYIEPRMIFVYESVKVDRCFENKVKVINTVDGSVICEWETPLSQLSFSNWKLKSTNYNKYYNTLQYPSKVVVDQGDNVLHLFVQ